MVQNTTTTLSSTFPLQKALGKMTEVTEHINAMKRKYDAAVHIQEVQSLIRGWEVPVAYSFPNTVYCMDACFTLLQSVFQGIDLTKYGDLVLEVSTYQSLLFMFSHPVLSKQ